MNRKNMHAYIYGDVGDDDGDDDDDGACVSSQMKIASDSAHLHLSKKYYEWLQKHPKEQ